MTKKNSASIDSSPEPLPISFYRDGAREDGISTQNLNQAVNIALNQCQSQCSEAAGSSSQSNAIFTLKSADGMVSSCEPYYPQVSSVAVQDEWQRLEHLKEDFLSTVSHELKTPLSSMYLSIQLLELLILESGHLLKPPELPPQDVSQSSLISESIQDHSVQGERPQYSSEEHAAWSRKVQEKQAKIKQCLDTLSSECKKEIVLVNNLLSLQESRAGLPSPALACIFLHDWLRDILTPICGQFKHKRHQFYCDVPSSLSYIIADRLRLEKILQELITNACKFTPDEGQISLSIWEQENILMLTVLNKGEVIPCDEIPNLFNIFYRIPRSDPWQERGTGIGLALVKKWAESIGGEIRVATGAFGNAFTLYLPSTKQMKQVGA